MTVLDKQKIHDAIYDPKYRSRKFIIALLLIISTTILAGMKIMTGTEVTVIFSIVGAGYGFANVAEKKLGITSTEE